MNLVERAKNILLTPAKEWAVIKGEQLTIVDMFTKYAMILAAIPAVAGFIGYSLIGVSYGFGTFRVPIGTALVWAILQYILSLAGVFVIAFIMDALAPTFGCTKNLVAAVKIVVFSYTAAWVAGILNIIPSLGILVGIASIYSLYLMYMGLQIVKDVPKDKMVGYFVVTIIAAVVVFVVIGMVVGAVAFGSMRTMGGLGAF
ncbi:MAG: Yip1 family protein [Candidatus Aminicenantes bacterium]|nr:Yip1 family protein [Candidatus Aminicenantes bacterium]